MPTSSKREPNAKSMHYSPIVLSTRQSAYGYWIVTISAEPGLRMDVMCAILGITSENAEAMVMAALPTLLHARGGI